MKTCCVPLLAVAALLSACSYGSRQNFAKIPPSRFFDYPISYVGEPFDGEWRAPDHKAIQGDLFIKIDTAVVADPLSNAHPDLVEAAAHLAHRFEVKLKEEFARLQQYGIYLVEAAPKGKTLLTVKPGLIDLHVTNAVANAAGDVAGFWIPGASTISSFFDNGHITAAVKVYAGDKLVAEFAECDTTPLSLVGSLNNYSAYGNQREIIDQWAHAIAMDVKNFAIGRRVTGANRIQLFSLFTADDVPSVAAPVQVQH